MADKKTLSPSDQYMQEFLSGIQHGTIGTQAPEPTIADAALESDRIRALANDQVMAGQRDLGDYLQDTGAGLMGTFGGIGTTAILGVAAAGDALGNATGTAKGWEATQNALELAQSTSSYWNDLKSEKTKGFNRISQYRQERAIEQANAASRLLTGEDASWVDQQAAAFGAAAGSYIDNPDQIVTEGIAQLPYMLTGGAAKALTKSGQMMSPLIARMAAGGMGLQSARKLVQMGLVGGMQGTIEGADAASQAYARVMASTDSFGPGQEAEQEIAALKAAGKAFGIAGATSAITGTLASKWELEPFKAMGHSVLTRTGDNLVKALQEGVQETIESGTSQFASNYAGNTVLKGKDQVALEQGVGGAAGTGFMVGMGSTAVTNPRSAVDAAAAPLVLAGKGLSYMGSKAATAERKQDMEAAAASADAINEALVATPTVASAIEENVQTVDTPPENVVLPPEVDTRTQIGLFATGMEYLRGKDMNSHDAISAFHVLGSVLAAANNIRTRRENAKSVVNDESYSPEDRAAAKDLLTKFDGLLDNNQLDKWVEQLPTADIESELNDLKENPENFGAVIAHLAAMNPLKMTDKLTNQALEAKSLSQDQRNSLLLAQDLQKAAADLKISGKPNSAEVTRSMMQTGFPGYKENDSVAGYISRVTTSLAENDQSTAQIEFNRLVKFANFEQGRAAAYEAAKDQMAQDPDSKQIDLPGYYQIGDNGKLDKTKPQFVNKKSLDLVKTVRKDADAIQKMVELLAKRTGLSAIEAAPAKAPVQTPAAKTEAEVKAEAEAAAVTQPKTEKPATKPEIGLSAAPATVQKENELANLSDEAIAQEIDTLTAAIRRRRNDNTGRAVEQDIRYNNLVREQARRHVGSTKPTVNKVVDKKPAVAQEAPVAELQAQAAPVDIVEQVPAVVEATTVAAEAPQEPAAAKEVAEVGTEPSKNHFTDLMPSYPVAKDATVAEQNDAKNHLSQSFTPSDQPGLQSKGEALTDLAALEEATNVAEEDKPALAAMFNTKNKLLNRMQQLIGIGGVAKAKHMLAGGNFWKLAKYHFLYATKWDAKKGISYQQDIAQIMAWTGVQHMLDMVNPVSWSNDLIQVMMDTYGPDIREKLMDGWVPLKEQTEQVARKLQTNLALKGDKKVPVEYTEGTMLALAGRIIESMITGANYNGVVQHETIMTLPTSNIVNGVEVESPSLPVQWIRMSVDKTNEETLDKLYAAARILEDFLPERASTNQAHIGTAPKGVNPLYRGSLQKISNEQKTALQRRANVAHKLSPLLFNMHQALTGEPFFRLFGMDMEVKNFPTDKRDLTQSQIARKGANNTTFADLQVIDQHMRKLEAYAKEHDMSIHEVASYFEYEQVSNGRAMTKGTSPQSSKWYRELFAIAQYEVDPSKENLGFKKAVAQGLGIKMDIQKNAEALAELEMRLANPVMQRALEAAARLGEKFDYSSNNTLMEDDLTAIEKLALPKDQGGMGIELSPHAMSALVHYAQYQKGKPFTSSLMFEIDGKTDGPINLMMLLGLSGSSADMQGELGLAGLLFGDEPVSVQDVTELLKSWNNGSKDLYEIITSKTTEVTPELFDKILKTVVDKAKPQFKNNTQKQAAALMKATLHMVKLADLSKGDAMKLSMEFERAFSKKSTQAAGYLQGVRSISADLLNTMLESISAKMDAGTLSDADKAEINTFFSHALGSSKDSGIYFQYSPPAYKDRNGQPFVWTGKPLSYHQQRTAIATINTFIGGALFHGLVDTIGKQRKNMESAVLAMNARVEYADHVLRTRYKAKQDSEVALGRLHPGQALSKADEQAIVKDVWEKLVPHPVLRNTAGLPVGSIGRSNGNASLGSVKLDGSRRIENRYFESGMGTVFSHYSGLTEAMLEDPSVSFAALSIMAAGDGSMMTGLFNKMSENVLDMYDGLYMSPEIDDQMGTALNQEVKANWEHDFIGAILTSLQKTEDQGFSAWASTQRVTETSNLLMKVREAEAKLAQQRERQIVTMRDINSRPHSVSHMAGSVPAFFPGTPLNSDQLGTTKTDPLLDTALDAYGESSNGIKTLTKADVISLLNQHTFENPVLSGLWKVLSPLINDNLRLYVTSDRQAMADFYQQSERQEMSIDADGIAIGDRVYIRAVNSETFMHELLHYTTKSLVATYYRQPSLLTVQQRDAMQNLENLMADFQSLHTDNYWVQHAQVVVNDYAQQGDYYAAMEEFLAYGLTNYHLQQTLGTTAAKIPLLESIFQAVKKLFGFPAGTQSDSMLASMFSNFSALIEQTADVVYPVVPEIALQAVNPELARSFGDVLTRMEQRSATITQSIHARNEARTRMQELADSNLFPTMTNEQQSAGEYLQAMFSTGLRLKATDSALLVRVVDAVREEGPKAWRSNQDPADQADIDLAQARYEFFFQDPANHDQVADILAMSLVNPEFAGYMDRIILPQHGIEKGSVNNWLDSSANMVYEKMDTGLALKKDSTLGDALEVAALRMRKSLLQSVKRQEAKPGLYRQVTEKLSEGVQFIGEMAGKTAEARMKLKANKDWISSGLTVLAGATNDRYADMLGNMVLSLSNQMDKANPAREVIQEMTGTTSDNFKLIQLKGIAARMVSAIRQTFREQVPVTVKSWFKDLTPEQDSLMHLVIGKMATYSLSQDVKDQMDAVLTDPTHAKLDAEMVLMSGGNRKNRLLMIKYAKELGDYMANKGKHALYRNTPAIAGLAVHAGADALSEAEMTALENLSTLQALSHLTPTQRRQILELYRNNTEGFWKTTALIHSFQKFDTQRAGEQTASMNFQKGWIPVEADGRKKVKLFQKSEVKKAERMGWVEVGTFADDSNLVYMATTVGKTPTLSGGAIHAVDFHMNGIHFHSGLPTDPGIQTVITHPKAMREIQSRILNGESVPYTALYDAEGDVVGFQRMLDPAMVERHTKTVGRVSDAAGIWLGRLHEERVAHGQNQAAADLLRKTWDQGQKDKRENEFVNIRQPVDPKDPNAKQDKVLANVWETLPYHTKVQLENAFADGSKNPPIWIRRDQLNDAIGYHKAGVGNFFTGDNRYEKHINSSVAALSRQMLGKNAYKYLTTAESGWQAVIGTAKDTIIVKSLTVAVNNLMSNQIQLFMVTGNPVWNLRVQSQKHKELVSYLGYQQRVARLTAEGLATNDPKAQARIDSEQAFLHTQMRKLSIYPLIEAGEMPTIKGEGLSETEEFSLMGDFTEWAEKQVGKLPGPMNTVLNHLTVSKETSLYKGLDRLVQYGDFVAKAAMYEWLTTQDKQAKKDAFELYANDTSKKLTMADALHEVALREINDEFVNYARLPGRWRTYGEDMGLTWFYNYKLRIMKIALRRIRKNPAAFLIGAQVGGMLGIDTLLNSLPGNVSFSYSTGLDPLFSAHEAIIWNQMF